MSEKEEPADGLRAFVSSDEFLHCPQCEGFMLHPIEARVAFIGIRDLGCIINSKGIEAKVGALPAGRGTRISLAFWCENCHCDSVIEFNFHKGSTTHISSFRPGSADRDTIGRD